MDINETTELQAEAEAVGLVAASVILLLAFSSLAAAGLPVLTALAGLGASFLLITLLTRVAELSTFTTPFAAMMGLGVGIDYALFIVSRYREGLAVGLPVQRAAGRALDTAGRTVAASGGVVVIAFLGLFTIGIPFVTALATVTAIVVALAVLVALTLLPALLGFLGRGIDRWKVPRFSGRSEGGDGRIGDRLGRLVLRRPLLFALGSSAPLILMANSKAGRMPPHRRPSGPKNRSE